MGIYDRYKKNIDGFRNLVIFLETSTPDKFAKFVELGKNEDPEFLSKALKYVISFDDILAMEEMQFNELFIGLPPKFIADAIGDFSEDEKLEFLKRLHTSMQTKVRNEFEDEVKPGAIINARIKIITEARALEKAGAITLKKIPYLLEDI